MAKFTVERWRCDRCGDEADRWLKPPSAYSVRASVDYGTAGGIVLDWKELCVSCNDLVERLVRRMGRDTDIARERSKDTTHD